MLLDESAPTAFVCASDTLAMGVLHTLWIRQLAPGRDIAVVGFDDSQVAQVFPVGLTSVRQPLEDVAVAIVRALEALLSHQSTPATGVLLTPTLAIRESSCPPVNLNQSFGVPTHRDIHRTSGSCCGQT